MAGRVKLTIREIKNIRNEDSTGMKFSEHPQEIIVLIRLTIDY